MTDFVLGRHEERLIALDNRIGRIENTMTSMDGKLDLVLTERAQRKGERKVIAAVATAAGGLGSFLVTLFLKGHA